MHDTPAASSGSGAKMLCADLAGEAGSYSGTFSYLATHPGTYGPISMTRASLRTPGIETEVDFVGSAPDYSMFGAHLHADDCANNGGGVSAASFAASFHGTDQGTHYCAMRV